MKWSFLLAASVMISASSMAQQPINPYKYEVNKSFKGKNGAVVSAHPLASQVGLQILQKGGNAIDAAIATQLALAVVYPGAGNIGGGGFMVAHLNTGENITIDFRETAPSRSHRDMFLMAGEADLDKSQNGHLASGVPGTISGLFLSHRHARLSFKDLIAPAIDLAEKGFVISKVEAENLNREKARFEKYNSSVPVFVRNRPWVGG